MAEENEQITAETTSNENESQGGGSLAQQLDTTSTYQDLSQRCSHHGNLILINGFGTAILGSRSSGTDVEVTILCGRIPTDTAIDAPRTSTVSTR